ncbi:hypothetical protein [Streptomyces sp. NPDC050535]|uniref:hypothetical protein n=1 Tax=Streptomyces sp. NPDC050535 TaxID=3365626 RepID=UPI0037AAC703
MAVDMAALERGITKTNERLDSYRGFRRDDNPGLRDSVDAVFDRMRVEGPEINTGVTPVENQAVVDHMMELFNEQKAFEVRGSWRIQNQDKPEYASDDAWRKALSEAAATHVQNTGGWSKTTGMPAELLAENSNGRTLEITAPGSAFDGIHFGNDRDTPFPTLNYVWGGQSKDFMAGSRGMVHAQVLRGIDESSVLNKIEMPELLRKMSEKEVDGVTFHVRRRNQQTGVLDETDTFTVASRASWARVQMLQKTDSYIQEQGREYQTQQIGRAIYRNRDGMQHSLDNFKKIIDAAHEDPNTAVIMTSSQTPFPDNYAVSAQEWQGWERRASQGSDAPANWVSQETAVYTLMEKLDSIQTKSGTQSPASTESGEQSRPTLDRSETVATVQSRGSVGDGTLAPVTTTVSRGDRMEPSSSQQLPTVAEHQPGARELAFRTPQYGGEPLAHITTQSTVASPAEVRNAPSYFDSQSSSSAPANPTGGFLQRDGASPSGDSTSSSDGIGEPLTRVKANTTPPPAKRGR